LLIKKEKLKKLAEAVGISQLGVTTAKPLEYMRNRLQRRINEGWLTPFEEKDTALRVSPEHLLTGCRSIIVLVVPYMIMDSYMPESEGGLRGIVARCARGIDYHNLVEAKAAQIVSLFKRETGSAFDYRILSDRSPLLERELACNAGMGWIGENCTLINSRYGSFSALGTILVNLEIEADDPVDGACHHCSLCHEACPTKAIEEPYRLNPHRCLSYLNQAAGIFPRNMRRFMENRIYGCDRCQEVCPHNQAVDYSPFSEFSFPLFPAEPLLIPLLTMTRKEFDQTIGLTSAGWRGKTILQRNAVIALGNSVDQAAVRPLSRLLENDPRPLIRLHSAWSLGRIGGSKARYALEKSRQNDPDTDVKEEVLFTLESGS
jgi:epoxyqueuosine reductase